MLGFWTLTVLESKTWIKPDCCIFFKTWKVSLMFSFLIFEVIKFKKTKCVLLVAIFRSHLSSLHSEGIWYKNPENNSWKLEILKALTFNASHKHDVTQIWRHVNILILLFKLIRHQSFTKVAHYKKNLQVIQFNRVIDKFCKLPRKAAKNPESILWQTINAKAIEKLPNKQKSWLQLMSEIWIPEIQNLRVRISYSFICLKTKLWVQNRPWWPSGLTRYYLV